MKWTYEICANVATRYTTKKDFRAQSSKEFQWLYRNRLLDLACAHMTVLRREISDDDIAKIAKEYTHRRAFKIGDQAAYNAAWSRGILDTVCAHMLDRHRRLSNSQLSEIASRFTSRIEFLRSDKAAYQTASKRGILDEICAHMDEIREFRRLSDQDILSIAKRYETRRDFKLDDFGAYITAIRRGLIDEACVHMERGAWGFRDDKPGILYQLRVESADGLVLYKVGITNRTAEIRMTGFGLQRGAKVEVLDSVRFESGRDARMAEKQMHSDMRGLRYAGPPLMSNGNRELFIAPLLFFHPSKD